MEEPSSEYLEVLRKIPGETKLKAAAQMWWSARKFKAAWLREQYPDWSELEIDFEVKKIMLYAGD